MATLTIYMKQMVVNAATITRGKGMVLNTSPNELQLSEVLEGLLNYRDAYEDHRRRLTAYPMPTTATRDPITISAIA